ncbi:MAG: alpha-L-fucosidase [Ignavibacteriae bacterium]|nr:alpha-L-fucosidase [Ignavibacteriota bacterium]
MNLTSKILIVIIFSIQIFTSKIIAQEQKDFNIQSGIFEPTWESFEKNYKCPDWFRDAKFGIWAHWSAQCVPEQGDWYARNMYIQGNNQYDFHLQKYGHPSKFGFMEIDNLWKAENWNPDSLMKLYVDAGAKYFVTLANHHDNFDNYNSKYHDWNSTKIGPKKDIVGIWEKLARQNGIYFGVSNHSAHAWHWFQTAYGYDGEGSNAGIRYDAASLSKDDGKCKWWEGLDPQDLYTGPNMVMPNGLNSISEINDWHDNNDRLWTEEIPDNKKFAENWFLRCKDLIDTYKPDLLYFDNFELPLRQYGMDITAHYYNSSMLWNKGQLEAVVNAKEMKGNHNAGLVEDIERGFANEFKQNPWQTCTCIGSWHYSKKIFDENKYKTVEQVVHQLIDIVSKNGNLLLSIPIKGDGTIDTLEEKFLKGISVWMKINGEAIYGTRPWKIYGEGPSKVASGMFNENKTKFTSEDIRFTKKDNVLYVFLLGIPKNKSIEIKALASISNLLENCQLLNISLLGSSEKINWMQEENGLKIIIPENFTSDHSIVFKIETNSI